MLQGSRRGRPRGLRPLPMGCNLLTIHLLPSQYSLLFAKRWVALPKQWLTHGRQASCLEVLYLSPLKRNTNGDLLRFFLARKKERPGDAVWISQIPLW